MLTNQNEALKTERALKMLFKPEFFKIHTQSFSSFLQTMSYPSFTKINENKIPQCISTKHCDCFHLINRPILLVPSEDYEKFIFDNLKWVDSYYNLIKSHQTKDYLYKTNIFSTVAAHTIKSALDHLYNNISIFEAYVFQSNVTNFNLHFSPTKFFSGKQIISAFKNISFSHSNLIETFQSPYNQLTTENLLNIFEIHLFCLSIFEQFCNLIKYGCNFYGRLEIENAYRITISIDR